MTNPSLPHLKNTNQDVQYCFGDAGIFGRQDDGFCWGGRQLDFSPLHTFRSTLQSSANPPFKIYLIKDCAIKSCLIAIVKKKIPPPPGSSNISPLMQTTINQSLPSLGQSKMFQLTQASTKSSPHSLGNSLTFYQTYTLTRATLRRLGNSIPRL